MNPVLKEFVVAAGGAAGLFKLGEALRKRSVGGYVRAVNYHATPAASAWNLRRQLRFYRRHFDDCPPARLAATLDGSAQAPAILLSFDDGYRSNYDIAAPLLEEHGLTGWFFVSSGRLRDGSRQTADGEDASLFMSPAELRDLIARGHVVGCHTHSHRRLEAHLDGETLRREIIDSRAKLRQATGDEIDNFCWVGGEEWSYSRTAHQFVETAGYRQAFMTNCAVASAGTDPLWIDRVNVEADWPLNRVRFYLSGVMDLAYANKRARLRAALLTENSQ